MHSPCSSPVPAANLSLCMSVQRNEEHMLLVRCLGPPSNKAVCLFCGRSHTRRSPTSWKAALVAFHQQRKRNGVMPCLSSCLSISTTQSKLWGWRSRWMSPRHGSLPRADKQCQIRNAKPCSVERASVFALDLLNHVKPMFAVRTRQII